jgi:Resolvase, N terminal domain
MSTAGRAVIYARVSADHQTTEHQLVQLREHAERAGYEITAELSDHASGKGRGNAPATSGYAPWLPANRQTLCFVTASKFSAET